MHEGVTSDLREELADDDEEDADDIRTGPPAPSFVAPFTLWPYPPLRLDSPPSDIAGQRPRSTSASRFEVTGNFIAAHLGVGFLAVPKVFSFSGLMAGLASLALVAVAARTSMLALLGMGAGTYSDRGYLDLARRALGPQGFAGALLAHFLLSIGLLSAYLVVLTDLLEQGVSGWYGHHDVMPRWVLSLVALFACTPAAVALRELRYNGPLGAVAAITVGGFLLFLLLTCALPLFPAWLSGREEEKTGLVAEDAILGFGSVSGFFCSCRVLLVQFTAHAGALEIAGPHAASGGTEMQELSTFGSSSSSKARSSGSECSPFLKQTSLRAYQVSGLLIGAFGTLAYLRFGERLHGNALLDFDIHDYGSGFLDMMLIFTQAFYGLLLIISFTFILASSRNAALELLVRRNSGGHSAKTQRKAVAAILVAVWWVSRLLDDLSKVLSITGIFGAIPLALAIPAIVSIEVARQRERRPYISADNGSAYLLVLFSVVLALFALVDLLSFAFTPPAGHKGSRIQTHSLLNITTQGLNPLRLQPTSSSAESTP